MRVEAKTVALALVVALVLVGMWYQTFRITGVTAQVVSPGADRPAPPAVPPLAALPQGEANIELFRQAHPLWSALEF